MATNDDKHKDYLKALRAAGDACAACRAVSDTDGLRENYLVLSNLLERGERLFVGRDQKVEDLLALGEPFEFEGWPGLPDRLPLNVLHAQAPVIFQESSQPTPRYHEATYRESLAAQLCMNAALNEFKKETSSVAAINVLGPALTRAGRAIKSAEAAAKCRPLSRVTFDACSDWNEFEDETAFSERFPTTQCQRPSAMPDRYPCLCQEVGESETRHGPTIMYLAYIYDYVKE